jgi:hypothetical protein
MNATREVPSMEEEYGWPYDEDDDPPIVTESDIDVAAEIEADDEGIDYDEPRRENKWNSDTWSN